MGHYTEPTSPVKPLAPYPPDPPLEYKSRVPEFYGFVAWTSTYILFVVYVLWALVPDEYIIWAGIDWYPSREWALLLPAYSIVLVLLTYFVYFALAIFGAPSFSSMKAMIDSRVVYPPSVAGQSRPQNFRCYAEPDATPELYDIPVGLVSRVLYSRANEKKS